VNLQPIDKDLAEAFGLTQPDGALVVDVVTDSPADKAGLTQGDIITKINGNPVKSPTSLRNDIMLLQPHTKVTLTINRNGKIMSIPVTLGTQGESTLASSSTASHLLGITVDNLTNENIKTYKLSPDDSGVVILDVTPGSAAAKAGLQIGNLIKAVNHKKVTNVNEFNDALKDVDKNKRVLILVKRGEMMRFLSLRTS
jgi:serine protease Do